MATLPVEDQRTSAGRRNIFEDPAIIEAGRNDPFVRFMSKNWRVLLSLLVAGGLGLIGYSRVTATALQKRADATKILREVQDSYAALVEKSEALRALQEQEKAAGDGQARADAAAKAKKEAEEVARLEAKLGLMLAGLDSPQPFSVLAGLYRGLIAAQRGDFEGTRAALVSNNWELVSTPSSPERAVAELAALALAKALVDSEAHVQEARRVLVQLAERGEFVGARAVDALASVAQSPEEREQARQLVQAVQQRAPAQGKLLTAASEKLAR